MTAVTALDDSRADAAGSAGEDGAVRAIALDGGGGRGLGGGFGGGRGCLIGHLGPVRALAAVRGVDAPGAGGRESVYQSLADDAPPRAPTTPTGPPTAPPTRRCSRGRRRAGVRG